MGILDRLMKGIGYVKAGEPAKDARRWLFPESEAASWEMPDPSVYGNQADLYRKLADIGTVVDAVTNSCISADMDVEDANDVEDDSHPLIKLLDRPNPYDSRTEFLAGHFAWRKISGNSYWWLNRPNANTPPDEVWILPPSKCIPVPDGRMGLRGYMYYPGDGQEIQLETWEVLHFKSFNPFNRYLGLSAIESLAVTAFGAIAASEWNTKLFAKNNARLPGILAFKDFINDTEWEKIKMSVEESANKRTNMMLRGVGAGGVDWIQSTISQREMEFLEGLDHSTQQIFNRLAPGFYNMLTSNSSLANGQTGDLVYLRDTVAPLLRETSDKINSALMPTYGDNKRVDYEDVIPEDKAMKLAEIEAFAKYHTVDEVRVEKYGNKPDPDKERGSLFASQITAKSTTPQPDEPVTQPPMAQDPAIVENAPDVGVPQPEEVPVEDTSAKSAVKLALGRWKRYALRTFGKNAAEFQNDDIPEDLKADIIERLKACKSELEVADVFEEVKPIVEDPIKSLARAIEKAVASA